jgi:hypothetical protein
LPRRTPLRRLRVAAKRIPIEVCVMTEPTDPALNSLLAELESRVPNYGAKVRLDYGMIVANRAGFLRLGTEFLRAGLSPTPETEGTKLPIDFGDLIHDDSSESSLELYLTDDLSRLPGNAKTGSVAGCACLAFVLAMFAFTIIGLVNVIGWVKQQL